ncbi:MAG: hypothetical protein BWY69_01452 [Planctomycetes bacterium ADurb.Bin401]|nr:MAG: hypothetical protein BWY69_01452 [Planctomycetes bacterium ADurb.Bin401]
MIIKGVDTGKGPNYIFEAKAGNDAIVIVDVNVIIEIDIIILYYGRKGNERNSSKKKVY